MPPRISACFARKRNAASRSCRPPKGSSAGHRRGPAMAALVEEDELPLTDAAVDRVLLVHALEMSTDAAELLREVWRVLAPGGRLLAVVPNRRGLWARMDTTPFGQGRPYSRTQITQLLRETWFTPNGWDEALYVPPIGRGWFLRSAVAWSARAPRSLLPLPASISSRPPSRFTAPFRRAAKSAASFRH